MVSQNFGMWKVWESRKDVNQHTWSDAYIDAFGVGTQLEIDSLEFYDERSIIKTRASAVLHDDVMNDGRTLEQSE